jgi:hypothetical protein
MVFDSLKKLLSGKEAAPTAPARKAARLLDQGPFQAPTLALDARGRATAIWRAETSIKAIRFFPKGEPEGPVELQAHPGAQVGDPLLLRSEEALLAVWTVREGRSTRILARLLNASLEGEPHTVVTLPDEITALQGEVDRRGDAVLAWVRRGPEGYFVEALTYARNQEAWDATPTRLDGPLDQPTPLALAPEPKGSALAVWNHTGGGYEGLVASHYFGKERIWSDRPVGIAPAVARSLQLSTDDQGNAILLYLSTEGPRTALDACVFSASTYAWHGPHRLASAQEVSLPQVGMDRRGAGLAVWRQSESSGNARLFSRAFQGGKWAPTPEALEGDMASGKAHAFALSPDARGVVVWAQAAPGATAGAEGIFLRTFTHGRWDPSAQTFSPPTKYAHHSLCVAVAGEYTAALWLAGLGRCGLMGLVER